MINKKKMMWNGFEGAGGANDGAYVGQTAGIE